MSPWLGLAAAPTVAGLIGGGATIGLAKSEFIDKPRADRQRRLAAETARYSPWTGMTPQMPQEPDPFGSALQWGLTGASLGQNLVGMPGMGKSPYEGMKKMNGYYSEAV